MILKLRFVILMQSEATKLYRNSASNIRDHITNNFAMSSYIATKTVHTKSYAYRATRDHITNFARSIRIAT